MFEATLTKALLFKNVIASVEKLVSEIEFEITSAGITVQQMDSAHVALVEIALSAGAFESFRCDNNCSLAVGVAPLLRVMKMIPNNSTLRIVHQKKQTKEHLEFHFHNGFNATSKLVLIDIDQEKLGIPDAEYAVSINADKKAFHDLFANLAVNGDTASMKVVDSELVVAAKGEGGSFKARFRQGSDDKEFELTVNEHIPALEFSLAYLNKMTGTSLSNRVIFDIAADLPGRITYKIEQQEEVVGAVRFYLAPKINED